MKRNERLSMKNILWALMINIVSLSTWAFSQSSIDLVFQNGDPGVNWDYRIPNGDDSALKQLRVLTSDEVGQACLNGNPKNVLKNLNALVDEAGAAVEIFSAFDRGSQLALRVVVRNEQGQLQNFERELSLCE